MAILESLPGIEVTVRMRGRPLLEYENNDQAAPKVELSEDKRQVAEYQSSVTVSKVVESVADRNFTIKCSVRAPYEFEDDCTGLSFKFYVDGEKLEYTPLLLGSEYLKSGCRWEEIVKGEVKASDTVTILGRKHYTGVGLFRFINLRKDEENSGYGMTAQKAELVGNIKVLIHRETFSKEKETLQPRYNKGRRLRNVKDWVGKYVLQGDLSDEAADEPADDSTDDSDSENDEEMTDNEDAESLGGAEVVGEARTDEETLKGHAKSHAIALGSPKAFSHQIDYQRTEFCDGEDYPIAIFHFRYGSKEDLQALKIIEKSPEPEVIRESAAALPPLVEPPSVGAPFPTLPDLESVKDLNGIKSVFGQFIQRVEACLRPGLGPTANASAALPAATILIKREREDTKDGIVPKKRRKWVERTIIDLTGDDSEDEDT